MAAMTAAIGINLAYKMVGLLDENSAVSLGKSMAEY
jgi:hypothetical protein